MIYSVYGPTSGIQEGREVVVHRAGGCPVSKLDSRAGTKARDLVERFLEF